MDIGEEDGDFAAGSKVLRNLDSGDEVTTVRSAGGCSALGTNVSSLASLAPARKGGLNIPQ